MNSVRTTHDLDFLSADTGSFPVFKIGTCRGQWGSTWDSYFILSVINEQQGNGHFDDVLEWFEHSAKRDNKNLIVLELWNDRLYQHLVKKRGFVPLDERGDHVIKIFNTSNLIKLMGTGNEILKPVTMETI